jgi:hypothetical protein
MKALQTSSKFSKHDQYLITAIYGTKAESPIPLGLG